MPPSNPLPPKCQMSRHGGSSQRELLIIVIMFSSAPRTADGPSVRPPLVLSHRRVCVSASTLLTAKSRSCQKLHPLVPCPNPNFRLRNASQLSERGMFCARWKCFHLAFWETRAVSGFGLIRPIKSRRGQPDRNSQSGFPCAFI